MQGYLHSRRLSLGVLATLNGTPALVPAGNRSEPARCKMPQTSLEPEETSLPPLNLNTYRAHIFHPHASEAVATAKALESSDNCFVRKQAQRMFDCRKLAWFVRHRTTGEVRVSANHCRHRWCPMCAAALRNWRTHAILGWITDKFESSDQPPNTPGRALEEPGKSPGRALEEPRKSPGSHQEATSKPPRSCKFVTLTKAHSKAPLRHQIDNLYKQFQLLRKQRLIKRSCKGGVWFFQIKRSKADQLWHPHIHMLIESDYIPQRELSRLWAKITHTSKIVDIRSVKAPGKVALYVSRYSARPSELALLPPGTALEVIESLHGKRLVGTWGTGKSIPLTPVPTTSKTDWQYIAAFEQVKQFKTTNDRASAIWHSWKQGLPLPESYTREPPRSDAYHDALSNETEKPYDQIPLPFVEVPP